MRTNNKSIRRLPMLAVYLGTIVFMLACMVFTGVQVSDDGLFRFDNNVVQVKDDNGDWVSTSGATFELVGALESMDPWTVSGTIFETRDTTQIAEGLEVGDLVRVKGVVLEDKTWVAYSIEPASEQTDPIIVLIGTVDSIDPWVVNGISLNVTTDTDIQGDITTGMIVRVEILLANDGTWEVLSIAPLGDTTETSGCVTVIATVVSVNGKEVQFLGWPATITLDDNVQIGNDVEQGNNNSQGEDEGNNEGDNGDENNTDNQGTQVTITLAADQVIQAVLCISDNGQIVIVQIIILNVEQEADTPSGNDGGKVLICHKPDKKGGHTLSLPQSAIPAHLGHGDTLGACP